MKRRLLGLTVALVMVCSVAAFFSACKKTPATYDLLGLSWAEAYDDGVYDNVKNTDGKLAFDYAKGADDDHEWSQIRAAVTKKEYNLKLYKTLVVKVKPTFTTMSGGFITMALQGAKKAEIMVYLSTQYSNFTADADGYYNFKWDLTTVKDIDTKTNIDFNKDIDYLRIFVEGGRWSVEGKMEFAEMYFSKTAVDATNDNVITAAKNNFTGPKALATLAYAATDEREIEIEGETAKRMVWPFNKNWADPSGEDTHTFGTPSTAGSVEVTVNKVGLPFSNGAIKVSGVPAKFKYAIFTVTGSEAINEKMVLFKASGANIEKRGRFADDDEVTVQINFTDKVAELTGFEVFGFPGDRSAIKNQKFTIKEAYLTETAVIAESVVPANEYVEGDTFDITNNWYPDRESPNWTVSFEDGKTILVCDRTDGMWDGATTKVTGMTNGFTKLTVKLQCSRASSEIAKSILKAQGSGYGAETDFLFDGTLQTIEVDLTGETSKITDIYLFFEVKFPEGVTETAVASATITIHSAILSK